MTLSIALTTYNGECFLREQLDSIVAQTITDWELIVCDDCSSDSTWRILEDYYQKDKRIRIFRNDENLGYVKNFEKAISLCSAEYIALSDQDDIWYENHLEKLLNTIKENSAAVGNATIIDEKGNQKEYILSEGDGYYYKGDNIDNLYTILCYRNPFFGSISMYKSNVLKTVAIPIPDCVSCHDVWFSAVACCINGLNYDFEPLSKHRIHGNNESGTHHISLWGQVLSTINNNRKEFSISRMKICDELLYRIPDMQEDIKNVIKRIREYHENRLEGHRLKTISFMRKHYKQIFSTHSYKQFLLRCISVLITG